MNFVRKGLKRIKLRKQKATAFQASCTLINWFFGLPSVVDCKLNLIILHCDQ